MAVVSQEVVVSAPVEAFFDLVTDYARYPEFVPGIRACRVLPDTGGKQVEYELDVGIRKIRYVLRHVEERPSRVSWSLVSGDMMKVSNGSWELTPESGGTRARYSVEIQIAKPPLVPQALVDRISDELTRVQLPKTLEAFKRRAETARGP
jgi:ribosome-associated toxin RatA of RatAB toxin-antitoxin module